MMGVGERSLLMFLGSQTVSVPFTPSVWVSEGGAIGSYSFRTLEGTSPFSCS